MTLGHIADEWIKRLLLGQVRYDPCKVETRWVVNPTGNPERFHAILNGNRKDRLEKKAA